MRPYTVGMGSFRGGYPQLQMGMGSLRPEMELCTDGNGIFAAGRSGSKESEYHSTVHARLGPPSALFIGRA